MKRLLVFSTQLMKTGGIENHVLEFCRLMSASGIVIDLIVPNFNMSESNEILLKKWCNTVFVNTGKPGIRSLLWLISIRLRLMRRYDAVYTNGQGNSIYFIDKLFFNRKRWIHHHHTAGDAADQATWSKSYIRALKKADKVIACSYRNAGDMKNALNRNIDVITCFSRKITVNNSRKLNNDLLHFGYYGRLIKEKGIDIICRLSDDPDMKSVQFHLWGEGENYASHFFKQYPNVQYHGAFNGEQELTEVISSLDAYLLLSTHPEGLPISLLEVMSAGLPWLSTDRGGISDIVCDPISTRIIPSDSDYLKMKAAILSLASDIKSGEVFGDKQRKFYEHRFSSTALKRRWLNSFGIE